MNKRFAKAVLSLSLTWGSATALTGCWMFRKTQPNQNLDFFTNRQTWRYKEKYYEVDLLRGGDGKWIVTSAYPMSDEQYQAKKAWAETYKEPYEAHDIAENSLQATELEAELKAFEKRKQIEARQKENQNSNN